MTTLTDDAARGVLSASACTDTLTTDTAAAGVGALYVIEIGDDRIKIGWSGNPAARLRAHRTAARTYGAGAGREWISPFPADLAAETALVNFCAPRATEQIAREFFVGVPFEDAVGFASTLTGNQLDRPAEVEQVLLQVAHGLTLRDVLDVPLSEMAREGQAFVYFIRDAVVTEYHPERAG